MNKRPLIFRWSISQEETLYEFIQTKFTSSIYWTTVCQILTDIARGMVYLHDHNIVQGSLRSHNILLHENSHQAVICDFGISRSLENESQVKTRCNSTKGNLIYFVFDSLMLNLM